MFAVALVLVCLLQYVAWSAGNVIGIDFASDSLKIAIVKPGHPLEIVTNFQSKRKTPTCLAFYKDERLFGSDAVALMGRKPELTFEKIGRLIGKTSDSPFTSEVVKTQYHPYQITTNETTKFLSLKVEQNYYTSEELIAMILQHVKDITHNFAGQAVKDCVLTVPSFFTQHEKEALYTAANIAELNVLSLIEENTGAALNYAMDRTFDEPTTVLYYNMGAGSVQVSIVTYSSYQAKEGGKNKTVGQFEVVGKAWDHSLGGYYFDLKIAEYLADKFNTLWQKKPSGKDKDIRSFVRPMTRLKIEANKIKEILSANNEFPYRIEQLHADIDLAGKITRHEFEEASADLLSRILVPVEEALKSAGLTIKDIHNVELLGGSVRIPKIRKLLDEYFKVTHQIDVGQHLNGDEAMALGAAFRAANLSTQFRVRKIGITDISPFDIGVRVQTLPRAAEEKSGGLLSSFFKSSEEKKPETTAEEEEKWEKHTVLFPAKSTFPSKNKLIAFNYDQDILCKIEYEDQPLLPAGTDRLVASYNITGVTAFAKEHQDKGVPPKVQLGFQMDNSGKVHLVKAEVFIEVPVTENTTDSANTTAEGENATEATNSTPAEGVADSATAEGEVKVKAAAPKKKAVNVIRKPLTVTVDDAIVLPPRWSPAQIAEAKGRLRALQAADEIRKAKAAALNDLESYIYKVKNRLLDEEDKLKAVSTDEQRQEVIDLANTVEDWLYDEGRDQTVLVYKGKQTDIQTKAEAIFSRFTELTARSEAITKVKNSLEEVKKAVNSWAEKLPHITEEEKTDLLKLVEKADSWIEEKAEAQEKVSPFEKPVFHSSEVPAQLKPVKALFEKLLKKPKPAPPVEKKENVTVNVNASSSDNSTSHNPHEEEVVKVKVEGEEEVKQNPETDNTQKDKKDSDSAEEEL
eukprot:CAMPEP_0173141230 /NCGR_PEP_ID=MMETSP1105-20130129/5369_1 /TAXON_ID=2985 /ORGANISM="Ochromonas sp., Strain BG-1" /LENGTH=913 /DNA_ID=CAMNT_0014054391 /DNA_START=66 /DNA_END=2807 /DNA_ORIENTATION=+